MVQPLSAICLDRGNLHMQIYNTSSFTFPQTPLIQKFSQKNLQDHDNKLMINNYTPGNQSRFPQSKHFNLYSFVCLLLIE